MAVGQGALISGLSYLAVGREIARGTYSTCTAGLDFISCSLKTMKEDKILEQVHRSRTYARHMRMGKVVEGDIEFYYEPRLDSCNFLLQQFFGGTVTSATATGETVGAGANSAMTHTFLMGNMDQSYPSLCLNHRKGPQTSGKIWEYNGVHVDEMIFSAELNDALRVKATVVAFDSTQTSNDVESASAIPTSTALSFVNGRFSVDGSFSSLTSGTFWHIQKIEFGHSNALKRDDDSRRIGSDTLQVCPPGMAKFTLKATVRFDTTTAYDAMIANTEFAAEVEFKGPTLPSSAIQQGIKFQWPKVTISDAGDPEVGGPDEMLTAEITFNVLRDDSSSTGYAVRALVTNQKTSYA